MFEKTETTTLAEAAAAAPEKKRVKFTALIEELGVGDSEVQDLLSPSGAYKAVLEGQAVQKDLQATFALFFDFCMREMRPPQALSPVSPVTVLQSNLFCV